jgi:hypothetical protein
MSILVKSKSDKRRAARIKVLLRATVSIGRSGLQTYPCILKDVSDTGCQVVGSAVELIGTTFILRAIIFKSPRRCGVAWRTTKSVGAYFLPDELPAADLAGPPDEDATGQ